MGMMCSCGVLFGGSWEMVDDMEGFFVGDVWWCVGMVFIIWVCGCVFVGVVMV